MYVHLEGSLENAALTFHLQTDDVGMVAGGDDFGDAPKQPLCVDALDMDFSREQGKFTGIPACAENTIALRSLETLTIETLDFMNGDVILFVDIAQHVITGNGLAAVCKSILAAQLFVSKGKGLLAVNGVGRRGVVFSLGMVSAE